MAPRYIALATGANAEPSWPDTRLVQECLAGNEMAWAALIDKYKNLIYSIPVRWGFSQSDASDIFQSVVAELLSHLGSLRDPKALAVGSSRSLRTNAAVGGRNNFAKPPPNNRKPRR